MWVAAMSIRGVAATLRRSGLDLTVQTAGSDVVAFQKVRNAPYSFGDSIFATVFETLTGGVFLTGFALYLGMGVTAIGLLAAIPYIATLFQLPAFDGKPVRISHDLPLIVGATPIDRTVAMNILRGR